MTTRPLRFALGVAAAALLPAGLAAQEAAKEPAWAPSPAFLATMAPMIPREAASARVVTTRHAVTVNGRRLAYRAIVTEDPLTGPGGRPAAVAVTYAYVADGARDAARPVMFVFNGGPGASSSPLHMKGFGPRRLVGEGAAAVVRDNPYTLLDVADLVFVDPVGTGASMPIKGADATGFFGVGGDAREVATIIADWQRANGRGNAPTILVGESYGTPRALAILHEDAAAKRRAPDGVVLLSLAIGGVEQPLVRDVLDLPSYAAVAWYHGAADRGGRTVEQQFARAAAFADGPYVAARLQGSALAPPERKRVAGEMAGLVGLPADTLAGNGLAVDKHDYMMSLLAARGLRTGQLDARTTRAIADSNFHPPFDDPSMSMGNETGGQLARYFGDELGYTPPSPYRTLNLGINFKWDYERTGRGPYAAGQFAPFLAQAMKADPRLLAFAGGGYYDLTTPVGEGVFALDQAGVPADRLTVRRYPAGHSTFEDEAGLAALSADLKAFVAAVVRQRGPQAPR